MHHSIQILPTIASNEKFAVSVSVSVPAANVWRPDITVYEEVGSRDLSPRLPFVELRHSGQILYAEPTILETSCSVNTAFFPFDKQVLN